MRCQHFTYFGLVYRDILCSTYVFDFLFIFSLLNRIPLTFHKQYVRFNAATLNRRYAIY